MERVELEEAREALGHHRDRIDHRRGEEEQHEADAQPVLDVAHVGIGERGGERERVERSRGEAAPTGDDARGAGAERECGERREVVPTEERRVAPARRRDGEHVGAEELQERDRRRNGAPEHDRADENRQLPAATDEERDADGQEPVLDELDVADEVVGEERVVERGGPEDLEGEPGQESRTGDPEGPSGAKRDEAGSARGEDRSHEDGQDGDVR